MLLLVVLDIYNKTKLKYHSDRTENKGQSKGQSESREGKYEELDKERCNLEERPDHQHLKNKH